MKFVEIQDLSVTELKKKRAALSEELFQARIKNSIGQLSNPIEIRNLRRNIAKINTAIVKKVAR
ncbi:50S ribosomal protein L29 [Bdellovibrio bacteriovorus]|uniref:Large ribosomal subunit protein uL29 n=1 Tax=Bdellovibrio bacteriovorus TaxID=959 RepID=A0A150WFZ9_BDEBC|nr:50S ribosomal protein L29 [Bdellovibrio bacteriovorus]KYG61969.1 50S ribosomal protein L29 [Bdellovibrio bacteriovorus]KYG68152.1 50S ribosomal protein L29 [Bdellovibrio bacteriovorus]